MTTENKFIDNLVTETIEESSEIIQVLCKLQKFGFYDFHPDDKDKTPKCKDKVVEVVNETIEEIIV